MTFVSSSWISPRGARLCFGKSTVRSGELCVGMKGAQADVRCSNRRPVSFCVRVKAYLLDVLYYCSVVYGGGHSRRQTGVS